MSVNILNLTQEEFDKCWSWGQEIHKLKDTYKSTRLLAQNSHGLGKIGELAFAKFCPRLDENSVDWNIQQSGDKLDFFGKLDIKTTTYFKYPELKENHYKIVENEVYYVLTAIKPEKRQVKIVGWVSSKDFLTRQYLFDNYKGLGSKFVAPAYKLSKNWDNLWAILDGATCAV